MTTQGNTEKNSKLPTHFIGIGASAGGLEALQTLLQNLPVKTGACYIIVQHLSPDFKSMMLELLSKHTSMDIENVHSGVLAKPNTIYLLPPKKNMIVSQGELLLADKTPELGLNLPIDVFFRSLAQDQRHRAIGIILSGTGSDGSRGIKALKEAGGLIIAQRPDSAKFDGMPNSAINTGIVDLILRPEEMGEQLDRYIQHPLVKGSDGVFSKEEGNSKSVLQEIFNLLKARKQIDFSKYKPSTIERRIERRMTIRQINSLQEYLSLLLKDNTEVKTLSKEMLIGVTRFFRDREAFAILEDKIISDIVEASTGDKVIRLWSAACSSGEEAYSLAMLMQEEITRQGKVRKFKVFATDVNDDAVAHSSSGIYGVDTYNEVPQHLLTKYFKQLPSGMFQVNQALRNSVVFAAHNMITDPPFSNIDLVTCRNVLIYFQTSAQKRVLSSLHFSLKKGGYLFLGSSEHLGELSPYFDVVSERHKLFCKATDVRLPLARADGYAKITNNAEIRNASTSLSVNIHRDVVALAKSPMVAANEALMNRYVPPCVLLADDMTALHIYGDTTPFLKKLPPGRISNMISDMVNDDISMAVSSAVEKARKSKDEVFYSGLITQFEGSAIEINMRISFVPANTINDNQGCYWLVFEPVDTDTPKDVVQVDFNIQHQANERIVDLESELKSNKEHLQVTVEELETTNEELQSANEELMSANEELQSTNEELQSVNEELYTVNSEYQQKITELSQANGDLDEVLGLSHIGIIFLDDNMLIRRYTEAAKHYINLLDTDINRPLHHISKNIDYDNLLSDVGKVLSSNQSIEKDIMLVDKSLVKVAIHVYQHDFLENTRGVAITFSDVSAAQYMKQGMLVAYNELRSSVNNALDLMDKDKFQRELRVLIIDDSEMYLDLLEEYLSSSSAFSVTIHKALDIATAMQCLDEYKLDLCICDYYLEEESAIDLLDNLKEKAISIPTVIITADLNQELNPVLLSRGALDLIDKGDISTAYLDKTIGYAIRRHQIDSEFESLIKAQAN